MAYFWFLSSKANFTVSYHSSVIQPCFSFCLRGSTSLAVFRALVHSSIVSIAHSSWISWMTWLQASFNSFEFTKALQSGSPFCLVTSSGFFLLSFRFFDILATILTLHTRLLWSPSLNSSVVKKSCTLLIFVVRPWSIWTSFCIVVHQVPYFFFSKQLVHDSNPSSAMN